MIRRPPRSTLFPSRRSSDLVDFHDDAVRLQIREHPIERETLFDVELVCRVFVKDDFRQRSEEHTSELQSHVNLVCRLLLEKKKTIIKATYTIKHTNSSNENA